jgi:FkbH-like protein
VVEPLPEEPPRPFAEYDFRLIQIPLRLVLPDLAFARLSYGDVAGFEALFEHVCAGMRNALASAFSWRGEAGMLTFVTSFMVPLQNPMGRLLRRHDLRNLVYFVEKLNERLEAEVTRYTNAYLHDINQTISMHGGRYLKDEVSWAANHASVFVNYDIGLDRGRLETVDPADVVYDLRLDEAASAVWMDLCAMYRSACQTDMVKMVVVDLDDTLWRGVAADSSDHPLEANEGWPMGLWEALTFLRQRGILLSIISKNSANTIAQLWYERLRGFMEMDDFSIRVINWQPKPENMDIILRTTGLLSSNVVYIDDNPVEREAMAKSFPGMRVLGGNPITWRRILLWSSETQVARITPEAGRRTEMVRAQVEREEKRSRLSQDEFLASLETQVTFSMILGPDDAAFGRCLELINKTNQFNTTGIRWRQDEIVSAMLQGITMLSFTVKDRYVDYGLVGVMLLDGQGIRQFVMSCRVLGMGIETVAIAVATELMAQAGADTIFAAMHDTGKNQPCRNIYRHCGFLPDAGGWKRATTPIVKPEHVTILA